MFILLGVIVVVIAVLLVSFYLVTMEKEEPKDEADDDNISDETDNEYTEYFESLLLDPPEDYMEALMSLVEENEDSYVRESAIFTLTDLKIRDNETDDIIDFLKDIAMNEEDENVRTAAYANIDLIRDVYPLEKQGSLELHVTGDIMKNNNITILANVSSNVTLEEEAIVGINSWDDKIDMLSERMFKLNLEANITQQVSFVLHLNDTGEFFIPVTLKLCFDIIESENIKKQIYLNVEESDGEFEIWD
jgi:hypothetical protein